MSVTMSMPTALPATLPAAILETVLTGLAVLFLAGAGGDMAAARHAARQMLAAYNPRNQDELRLAAIITSFSFRALEALSQAAAPDLPINRVLRLSGSAVSLSRESAKAERRLAQLQKVDQTVSAVQPAAAFQPAQAVQTATPETAKPPANTTPEAAEHFVPPPQPTGKVAALATAKGLTSAPANDEQQRDLRIAASIARAEAKFGPEIAAAIRADITAVRPMAQTA